MPDPADDLYGVDPDAFVAERDALAKRLKATGQPEDAAAIKKLRRPSASAWAVNQLARSDPHLIEAALTAGDRLREAMQQVVGGEAAAWREARADERQAVEDVVSGAARLLDARGQRVTDAVRRRVAASVRAAISDPAVADQLRRGALPDDVESTGLGLADVVPVHLPPRQRSDRIAAAAKEEDERVEREARAQRAKLVAEAGRLRQRAERLATAADAAADRARVARAEADEAEAAARTAEERAAEA